MKTLICLLLFSLPAQTARALAATAGQEAAKSIQLSQTAAAPLRNEDVIDMLKAGIAAEIVVAKIRASSNHFDTSTAALQKLKGAGAPDAVLLAMVEASSNASGATREASPPQPRTPVKIPEGTWVELETIYTINSQQVRKGDAISFRVVNPVIVGGATVIETGATATAIVTKAERNGHFGRAGRIAWSMKEVTAVDGSRVPLVFSGRSVGDSKGAKVAGGMIITGVLLWPIAPVALLHGFKRGENAFIPAGKRFEASVEKEATVKAAPPR
ncbi:MAG TPA: hypothetical protein VM934_08965 [Pyrinomonadaceae bacterium]|nr:hypothetical protein [Pyrinomonadaceae bacterium]